MCVIVCMDVNRGRYLAPSIKSLPPNSQQQFGAAIGSVYKEYTFVNAVKEIDINVMNAWVSFFQFFFGLALFPVAAPLEGISVGGPF